MRKREQIIMLWSNVIELQRKVIALEEKNTEFEAQIKELEDVVFALKSNVKVQKRRKLNCNEKEMVTWYARRNQRR